MNLDLIRAESVNGVVRQTWSTTGIYREHDADGVLTVERPFAGDVELEMLAYWQAIGVLKDNSQTTLAGARTRVLALLADLGTLKDFRDGVGAPTNAQINANPAQFIRLIAGRLVALDKAVIALGRVVGDLNNSTDVG